MCYYERQPVVSPWHGASSYAQIVTDLKLASVCIIRSGTHTAM